MKDWKTTLAGFIGGTTGTTVLLALTSPDVNILLSNIGVEAKYLAIIAGISKLIRDFYIKDKERTKKVMV